MIYKVLIGSLTICALTACVEKTRIAAVKTNSYECIDLADSNRAFIIDVIVKLKDPENPLRTKLGIHRVHPGLRWNHYKLDKADVHYYTQIEYQDSYKTSRQFTYENIDFAQDNNNLILKTPKDEDLPACEIKFDESGEFAEHKCAFEKDDVQHRTSTFNVKCQTIPGKYP